MITKAMIINKIKHEVFKIKNENKLRVNWIFFLLLTV